MKTHYKQELSALEQQAAIAALNDINEEEMSQTTNPQILEDDFSGAF